MRVFICDFCNETSGTNLTTEPNPKGDILILGSRNVCICHNCVFTCAEMVVDIRKGKFKYDEEQLKEAKEKIKQADSK